MTFWLFATLRIGDVFAARIKVSQSKTKATKMWVKGGVGMACNGMT
jgi:hypothetical protein